VDMRDRATVINHGEMFDCYKVMPRSVGGGSLEGAWQVAGYRCAMTSK